MSHRHFPLPVFLLSCVWWFEFGVVDIAHLRIGTQGATVLGLKRAGASAHDGVYGRTHFPISGRSVTNETRRIEPARIHAKDIGGGGCGGRAARPKAAICPKTGYFDILKSQMAALEWNKGGLSSCFVVGRIHVGEGGGRL
jgi:hypothetical protein